MGRSRYRIFDTAHPHFLTCTIVRWIPLFGNRNIADIVLDSLRFLHHHHRLTIHAYVLLENHLHMVASSPDLSKEIGDFKSFTARQIINLLIECDMRSILDDLRKHKRMHKSDRLYQLWQEGAHPQQIMGPPMMRQKIEYIHNNPVRRGYVDDPVDWRYSSARNYAGIEGTLDVEMEW